MIKLAYVSKDGAQQYLQSKLDKGAVNLITPTLIGMAFRAMFGLNVIGWGIDVLLRMMGVDFQSILSECCSAVVSEASSNEKVTPEKVDEIVSDKVDSSMSGVKKASSQVAMLKVAAGGSASAALARSTSVTSAFLKRSLSFLLKASLAAVGMELFTDFVAKPILGSDGLNLFGLFSMKRVSKQKKFAPSTSFQEINLPTINWKIDESLQHELSSAPPVKKEIIKNIFTSWTHEIYPTVDDAALNNSTELFNLVEKVYIYNYQIVNLVNYFFLPKDFSSKKDIVDYFIDDVAAHSNVQPAKVEEKK